LTSTLRYSGLGFASDDHTGSAGTTRPSRGSKTERTGATSIRLAKSAFDLTTRAATEADAELATAQRAIGAAEADLKRLQAAGAVAERRAAKAHDKAAAAGRRLDTLSHERDR
jgi:hypothetical protein